jgi:hypothetical protein
VPVLELAKLVLRRAARADSELVRASPGR